MLAMEVCSHLREFATAAADGYFTNVILEDAARRRPKPTGARNAVCSTSYPVHVLLRRFSFTSC